MRDIEPMSCDLVPDSDNAVHSRRDVLFGVATVGAAAGSVLLVASGGRGGMDSPARSAALISGKPPAIRQTTSYAREWDRMLQANYEDARSRAGEGSPKLSGRNLAT